MYALGIRFCWENLHPGERYIKVGSTLHKASQSSPPPDGEEIRVLSKQGGTLVLEHDSSYISKSGASVRCVEEQAMRLVHKHTDIPLPEVIYSQFDAEGGNLGMTIVPGSPLKLSWDKLDKEMKKRICCETWDLIAKWRDIPQPPELRHLFQCSADGSATRDPLIQDLDDPPVPLSDDHALRARIVKRYHYYGGRQYSKELLDMLPQSSLSVFTHADVALRNIMVDESHHITGILDWEAAGWYPDYWEYANIMRPACRHGDWQEWMDRTAPQKWDLRGIQAARRVLF